MFMCNIFKNKRKKKNFEDIVLSSLFVIWGIIKGLNIK